MAKSDDKKKSAKSGNDSLPQRSKDIEGLAIEPEVRFDDQELKSDQRGLMEVVIGPTSDLIGHTLASSNFRSHYNCTVIAIRQHGALIRDHLGQVHLSFGRSI